MMVGTCSSYGRRTHTISGNGIDVEWMDKMVRPRMSWLDTVIRCVSSIIICCDEAAQLAKDMWKSCMCASRERQKLGIQRKYPITVYLSF